MYKNQLQELAQRSCFNLPSYACIREGPDHAPRFKASVNFNGEIFESPTYSNTLRQAEHAAAEVALNSLSARGPSKSLTARVLDETGVYKNLLQETAHRAGLKLPLYTTIRSGPGHIPVFTSTVELAGMSFTGESAKTKKQAEKNAAIAAWSALKRMSHLGSCKEREQREDQDHVTVAKVLSTLGRKNGSRVFRRWDHYKPRGRLQKPHKDKNPNNNPAQQGLWKFTHPFSDPALETCRQNQNSFLSLLPPPPPRTMSKILPPNLSKDYPPLSQVQMAGNSQVKVQETPPKLDEHQRDDQEWINKISEAIKKKPIEVEGCSNVSSSSSVLYGGKPVYNPFPLNFSLLDHTSENARTPILDPTTLFKGPSSEMGRSTFNGVYQPQRIAPAVQIRSVIPVCAAAPVRIRPSSNQPSSSSAETELASTLSKLQL
ncbi:hypothetical protein CDL12_25790 [Handroanthus impetiginosus]|uniref:DRBM domain-containing protein n=1 Tax=Handroanthus impetiginosus TaxID=429701 RepID=A0A2G9G8U1_9LAMI|nr:hypothetical protein CDL12_25790 [Handroanthus impetiginosus]